MDPEKNMDELFEEETPVESEAEENTEPETEEVDDGGNEDGDDVAEGEGNDTPEEKPNREAELEKDLAKLKAEHESAKKGKADADKRIAAMLKELGYENEDEFWAEKKGMTPEAYRKQVSDEEAVSEAKQIVAQKKYAEMAAKDLAALKDAGLIDSKVTQLRDIENVRRFAQLREMGLTAEEAYRAANGAKLDERAATAARNHVGGKDHLTPHRSRPGATKGSVMSASERAMFKSLLRTDDDKAIEAAWKRANAQN